MLKGIIFDMDGVLIDSEPVHLEAAKRLFKELNLKYDDEYYSQFVGSTTDYMWAKMIADYNMPFNKDELMYKSLGYIKEITGEAGYPVMPHASELIRRLKQENQNLKMAIASSSEYNRIQMVLDKMQVTECFDGVVSGMLVQHPKPAPDTFLEAAKLLELQPDECIVIEDSYNGMKAAKAAGMTCIKYENADNTQISNENADYIIQGYEDIDLQFFEMVYAHTNNQP